MSFDPNKFKEQERAGFNMVASRYEKVMRLSTPVVRQMVSLANINLPGLKVLDLATGPGLVARIAAKATGPEGKVTGIDIAEDTLVEARKNALDEGLTNVDFQVMDAENLDFEDNTFDRAVCSFGLMHFPEPQKALDEIWRVLKPGGQLAVSVWSESAEVPFIQLALSVIVRNFPPPKVERPSMFRFGNPEVLKGLLEASKFGAVKVEKVKFGIVVEDTYDYWEKFLDAAGITAVALAKQPPEVREKLEQDTVVDLEVYRLGEIFDLSSNVTIAAGTK